MSENQLAAYEKIKNKREACGKIESVHPGYLGSQDTYYVGNIKDIGRMYQQTFVDTSKNIGNIERTSDNLLITYQAA